MRTAKMRNGRAVEFHGRNDITKHHTGSSDRTRLLPSRIFNLYWTRGTVVCFSFF